MQLCRYDNLPCVKILSSNADYYHRICSPLQFHGHPGGTSISVGGFTWSGHFTWIPYRHSEGRRASDPAPTATMAGGLFAADRRFFFDVGAYDEGMTGWGGENLVRGKEFFLLCVLLKKV